MSVVLRSCRRQHSLLKRCTAYQFGITRDVASSTESIGRIGSVAEWNDLLNTADKNKSGIVAQFTAVWCPPCRMIAPYVQKLAQEHSNITFVKIDIDENGVGEIVQRHAIASVPTFVAYKGIKPVYTFSGADKNELEHMVAKLSE